MLAPATSHATGASPANLRVGDLDLDGDLDVVLPNRASGTGGVALLRNDGLGGLAAPLHQAGGVDALELDLGDLDQDGDPDVVVRLPTTLQRIYNDGSGGLSLGGSFALPAAVLRLADLDRDGRTDVLAADSSRGNLQWFRSGQGGTFEPLRTHELQLIHPFAPVRILVRDLDGDGDEDVASTFTWLMNTRR